MHQEGRVGDAYEIIAIDQDGYRQNECQRQKECVERIPELREQELDLQAQRQPPDQLWRILQQDHHKAARPLEFLRHKIGEGARTVAVSDGVQRMNAPPAMRIHEQGRGMILGQFRSESADFLQRCRAHRIMGTDADRGEPAIVTGLQRAMHAGFHIKASARRPAFTRIAITNARCRNITDRRIGEGPQYVEEIARLRHMVGIELRDEIIALIAIMVVEEGQIAFLAPGAAGPALPMIVGTRLARRHEHAMLTAPGERCRRRVLIGKPGIMRHILRQHGAQCFSHYFERLRRCLGDDHGDTASGGDAKRPGRARRVEENRDEVKRQDRDPCHKCRHQNGTQQVIVLGADEPPLPEIGDGNNPEDDAHHIFHPLASRKDRRQQGFRFVRINGRMKIAPCHGRISSPKKGAAVRMIVSRSEWSVRKPSFAAASDGSA